MVKIRYELKISDWVRHFLLSWLLTVTASYMLLPVESQDLAGLAGIYKMPFLWIVALSVLGTVMLGILSFKWKIASAERLLMVCVFALYAASAVIRSFTWAFFGACILVFAVLLIYARYGWNSSIPHPGIFYAETRAWPVLTGAAALAFFIFVSVWGVCRVRSFSTPSYDFGIWAQMFHNMKTTGLPMTTLERDGLLSHFAVHVSPIYYLMLPFYCLVPRPETLQVLQAAILASAVIPLWKVGKIHGIHPGLRTIICTMLLLYPAYGGGTGYDLHENCFLTPLLLWLFYGIDKKNNSIIGVSAVLTLMVKEDAPVYVAIITLYVLLRSCLTQNKKGILTGGFLMVGSVFWFLLVTHYLAVHGDGVMNYRYQNFLYDGSDSLVTVIKAVFLCPMKAVYECVDSEKLKFIGFTMIPILGMPLLTRRYERYLLLIPYFLVNLMSDYRYQHDIMFQYTFGSTACLFYLVVVNVADLKSRWNQVAFVGIAVCICFGCFHAVIVPTARQYASNCIEYHEFYDGQRDLLDTIPEDVPVAATTFYTTNLSNRAKLYDVRYGSVQHILGCEYVVIHVTETAAFQDYAVDGEKGKENFVTMLLDNGYCLEHEIDGVMEIFRKIRP